MDKEKLKTVFSQMGIKYLEDYNGLPIFDFSNDKPISISEDMNKSKKMDELRETLDKELDIDMSVGRRIEVPYHLSSYDQSDKAKWKKEIVDEAMNKWNQCIQEKTPKIESGEIIFEPIALLFHDHGVTILDNWRKECKRKIGKV